MKNLKGKSLIFVLFLVVTSCSSEFEEISSMNYRALEEIKKARGKNLELTAKKLESIRLEFSESNSIKQKSSIDELFYSKGYYEPDSVFLGYKVKYSDQESGWYFYVSNEPDWNYFKSYEQFIENRTEIKRLSEKWFYIGIEEKSQ